MAKDYLFDDYEEEDDYENLDRKHRDKHRAAAKRTKDKERQESVWQFERSTRDDAPRR